jgi:hypothetical protein
MAEQKNKVEIGAVWNASDEHNDSKETVRAGRLFLNLSKKQLSLATAAPGLQ